MNSETVMLIQWLLKAKSYRQELHECIADEDDVMIAGYETHQYFWRLIDTCDMPTVFRELLQHAMCDVDWEVISELVQQFPTIPTFGVTDDIAY